MKHSKFSEVLLLVSENIPVLLRGERGSGKTTLIHQVAEELSLPFYAVSMTRQTTLSHLMGFISVNGVYVPSLLRKAIEHGGVFLLDEIDAADPNVILALNTIENGFVSFPDVIVQVHPDFRLTATANPSHRDYTGRSTLDAATLDRFDKIELTHDENLEISLVSKEVYEKIQIIRELVKDNNMGIHISMRDAIRLQKRTALGLTSGYIQALLQDPILYEQYENKAKNLHVMQQDVDTLDRLWEILKKHAEVNNEQTS